MPELKNPRHEAFVQEYVKDGNGTRAYKAVYGDVKGAKQSARNLLELASVQERLVEVRTELAVALGLSQDQIVEDLQSIFEMGKANPERGGLAAAHQAKAQQAKILGYASEKKGQPVEALTDVELVTQIREGTGSQHNNPLHHASPLDGSHAMDSRLILAAARPHESGVTPDVARTYREALQREGKDLPAYYLALSVYLGHFPTVSHGGPDHRSRLRRSGTWPRTLIFGGPLGFWLTAMRIGLVPRPSRGPTGCGRLATRKGSSFGAAYASMSTSFRGRGPRAPQN